MPVAAMQVWAVRAKGARALPLDDAP